MNVTRSILIADDEAGLRAPLIQAARGRGYDAFEADSGNLAVKIGCERRPHLSLLDLNMPDMTGVDVVKAWGRVGVVCPVIFMTAEASDALRAEAAGIGALAVLEKPFGLKDFLSWLARVFDETRGKSHD